MAGTRAGGLKARATNLKRHGKDFYKKIGARGGANGHSGGFACQEVGPDGLTGRERASLAGKKGGSISKRGKAKSKEE